MATLSERTNQALPPEAPGLRRFRRQRASCACAACHVRKVRCDVASRGAPCTNCSAFAIDCQVPPSKRRASATDLLKRKERQSWSRSAEPQVDQSHGPLDPEPQGNPKHLGEAGASGISSKIAVAWKAPNFFLAPTKDAGSIAYLGESSNYALIPHDHGQTTNAVHYSHSQQSATGQNRSAQLDSLELKILRLRGAFTLPSRALSDDLVHSFFKKVAPILPVINRNQFMKQYHDDANPPSLLLLQAVWLAGSRVSAHAELFDSQGSTHTASQTFYERAKALYDAGYENDRTSIVQALTLMTWFWSQPEGEKPRAEYVNYAQPNIGADVTRNVFYWTKVAVAVAQATGMHRSVRDTQLSRQDRRLWRRIWWCLFARDRVVAAALGRPMSINLDDCDVEMLTEEDFLETDEDSGDSCLLDLVHVQFFLQYVRLCAIMGMILSQQYSEASKIWRRNLVGLHHGESALAAWFRECPPQLRWDRSNHTFWAALLQSAYCTTVCLLHRAHIPATAVWNECENKAAASRSNRMAFEAASAIAQIIESLLAHDEIRYMPAFTIYSLSSSLLIQLYQTRSEMPARAEIDPKHISMCMTGLKEISKAWPVARLVHTVFETLLGGSRPESNAWSTKRRKLQPIKTENIWHAETNIDDQFKVKTEPEVEQRPLPATKTLAFRESSPSIVSSSETPQRHSSAIRHVEPALPRRAHTVHENPYSDPQRQPSNPGLLDAYSSALNNWHIHEEIFDAMWNDNPVAARGPG